MLEQVVRFKVRYFDLVSTVESGQIFRWKKEGNGYRIGHRDNIFYVEQNGNTLEVSGASPEFVTHFFGLDVNYLKIRKELAKDKQLAKAIAAYPGIHIIRQDPWECTVGFICSAFSNIKKIQLNMNQIVDKFGVDGRFPNPGAINNHERIKNCSTGYRSKYIFALNNKVDSAYFEDIKKLSYADAKSSLMELPGIGDKVADCIALFSLDKTEAFPVDVWVQRVMGELYFGGRKPKEKEVRAFAQKKWGKLAGYAQQYLFHWRRMDGSRRNNA